MTPRRLGAAAVAGGLVVAVACSTPPNGGEGTTPPPGPAVGGGAGAGGSGTGGLVGQGGLGGSSGGLSGSGGVPSAGGAGNGGAAGMAVAAGPGGASGAAGASGNGGGGSAGSGGGPSCGDGVHNPVTEACDDGNANEDDSCTAMCQINDLVAEPPTGAAGGPPGGGHLFGGRHPIAASAAGCAVALVDAQTYSLALAAFGPKGERLGVATGISESAHDTMIANPVLAALPDGTYAVAWTDFGADGDQSGVAVRRVDPMKGAVGAIFHANTTTEFSQSDVDILWTGTELVLAWVDTSDVATAPDLKIRRFGADLTAKAAEEVLAATADTEGSVALASFSGSWAAAWRTASDMEAISVTTASGISWSVGPYAPSSATDRPALVALDKAHLAVVFTAADDNLDAGVVGGGLRIAVLDVAHPGDSQAVDLPAGFVDPGVSGFADPAAAVVGSSVYVSWRSGVEPDFADARIWLREVAFSISASGVVSLDTSANAQLLPRQAQHSPGQSLPSLAASPLAPTGALATGWLDSNQTFANEGKSDVVFSFIPLPPLVKKTQIRIVGGGS